MGAFELTMEDAHEEERSCRLEIEKKAPSHPVLDVFFSSTWKAVDAYWKALRELNNKREVWTNGKGKNQN